MEQGTKEWFAIRLGKVTASRVGEVCAKTRTGYSAQRANYMLELLCERLTGNKEDKYVTAAMQRGIELEPFARVEYEIQSKNVVTKAGFYNHPTIQASGASPDGLIGDDGLIEIKCPNSSTHVQFLQSGKPDKKYIMQMQWQMACTGRKWCDFVSYDDRFPDNLAYRCIRINRDEEAIVEIEKEVLLFLDELQELENTLNAAKFAA